MKDEGCGCDQPSSTKNDQATVKKTGYPTMEDVTGIAKAVTGQQKADARRPDAGKPESRDDERTANANRIRKWSSTGGKQEPSNENLE